MRATGGRRVLVVDDNVDAADSLADLVRLLRHRAEVVYDGSAAIAAVEASRPDVVLCAIGLPGMSGYEVAKALRTDPMDGVHLVALSGYAQPEDEKRAIEAWVDGDLAKPPAPADIGRLLAQRARTGPRGESFSRSGAAGRCGIPASPFRAP